MLRRILALALVLGLLAASNVALADSNGSNNDLNGDGYVDRVHEKSDHIALYAEGTSSGYRTVGLTIVSLDPHWNNQNNGVESVRMLPYCAGAASAMTASGLTPLTDRVWPFKSYTTFTINDPGATVTAVSPTSSGTNVVAWAKLAIVILAAPSPGAYWYTNLANFFFSFVNSPGSSGIKSVSGGTNNQGYNNSYFWDYWDWVNSGNTSMPSSVSAQSGHLDTYKTSGTNHEYNYTDNTWAKGSAHSVTASGQIQYWYYDQTGYTYSWTSPTVSKAYKSYGF